ncbi:MAG TPA: M15 family metallopeptidase [Gemmatimonadota bacterium]|nr:M15 family metallopeptidase [Gemmatimonadota bacterium]
MAVIGLGRAAAPLVLLVLLAPTGCGAEGGGRPDEAPTPAGAGVDLVDVREVEPSIRADIRYADSNNFVGAPVDGYEAARCLLSRPAAEALARVQRELAPEGLGVLVYDCYRPQRAVDHFVRWAADTGDVGTKAEFYPNVDKALLFDEGYIAERSGHSRGSTVDLTLVRDDRAEPLDMGSPYDFFDPRSHTESSEITDEQLANRLRLRDAMEAGGFQNYTAEWWHYTLRDEPHPDDYFDLPIRP